MYNFLFISNFQHVIFLEKQIIKFKSLKKTNNPLFKINLNIFLQRSREVFANKSSLILISLEVDKLPNLVLIQNSTLDYNQVEILDFTIRCTAFPTDFTGSISENAIDFVMRFKKLLLPHLLPPLTSIHLKFTQKQSNHLKPGSFRK